MPQLIVQSLLTVLVTAGIPTGLASVIAPLVALGGTSKSCSTLAVPKGHHE